MNPPHETQSSPVNRATQTVDQTARELGISRASAYRAAHSSEIPTIRIGRRLLVSDAAIRRHRLDWVSRRV